MLPQVTVTQDKVTGTVAANMTLNVRNPFQPVGNGIRAEGSMTVSQDASKFQFIAAVSGNPSMEANVTAGDGDTTNVPLQEESESGGTLGFAVGLQVLQPVGTIVNMKNK